MSANHFTSGISLVAVMLLAVGSMSAALAQSKGGGKIVCWKDAAGKVVGCGDTVPPQYLNNSTKELDKDGNTRKTGESADEAAKRKVREQEQNQAKSEEQKRVAEQRRQDSALLSTFTTVKEIDLKRDRELQALDNGIVQQRAALKLANDRLADAEQRAVAFDKGNKENKPAPSGIKDDLARAEKDKARLEQDVAAKEKAKGDTQTTYANYKKRFMELKGISPAPETPAAAKPSPAAAPSTPPASTAAPTATTAPVPAKK